MSGEQGVITGHYINHWGVPSDIRPYRLFHGQDLAVLEFGPSPSRRSWRYATNGMSGYEQTNPNGLIVRTEIFACTASRAPWIDTLLLALAKYPFDNHTYLAEYDTIDMNLPDDPRLSEYSAILLTPPGPVDGPSLGLVGGLAEDVLVHQAAGLSADGAEIAIKRGGKAAWNWLLRRGEALLGSKNVALQ